MPILKVDGMGNLYMSSPDREDGGGYGYSPSCQEQGDLTLGAAFIKSGVERSRQLIKSRRDQEWLDQRDIKMRQTKGLGRANAAREAHRLNEMNSRPKMIEAALKKAIGQGINHEYSTHMSGNVMTANGQSGWHGLSRDQQTIHNAITGIGRDTSHMVDPVEKVQARHRIQAERLLRLKARR